MKWLIGAAFVAIIAALGSAGVFMLRGGREGESKEGRMMKALAWRVGLSVTLFLMLRAGYYFGLIPGRIQ